MNALDSNVTIRPAAAAELPQILSLLRQAGLIVGGVQDHLRGFLVAAAGARVVGSAGLEVYGDVALLRSVTVDEGLRGQGLGRRLVTEALANARRLACMRSHSSRPPPRRSSGAWDSTRQSGRGSILASPHRRSSATSAARRRWP